MSEIDQLIERVGKVQYGFTDILRAANEVVAAHPRAEVEKIARELYASEVHQARMLATYLFGKLAAASPECLQFLRTTVSQDENWRVQEILAQAFDQYCSDTGYEQVLPVIKNWLADPNANVRRAVTEGLRIWTSRPYFRDHPELAIQLLSQHKADASDYLRRSVGNALRDISRKHADLVQTELAQWDIQDKRVADTYKLASKFLTPG